MPSLEPEQQEIQLRFRALRNTLGSVNPRATVGRSVLVPVTLDVTGHAPALRTGVLPPEAARIRVFGSDGQILTSLDVSSVVKVSKTRALRLTHVSFTTATTIQVLDAKDGSLGFGLVRRV